MSKGKLIIALLLNFLFMPGAGHFFIKKKARGGIFVLATILILAVFTVQITHIIMSYMSTLPSLSDPGSAMQFSQAIGKNIYADHELMMRVYGFLLGVCYIVGAGDLLLIAGARQLFEELVGKK